MPVMHSPERRAQVYRWTCLAGVVLTAAAFRAADFPSRYETRVHGRGGLPPGVARAVGGDHAGLQGRPGGPQFWLGWGYAGAVAAETLISPPPDIAAQPVLPRALASVDRAVWSLYRDSERLADLHPLRIPRGGGRGGGGGL